MLKRKNDNKEIKNPEVQMAPPDASTSASGRGLPMFFRTPMALDVARHAQAGVRVDGDFLFARNCNSLPLNIVEFTEAVACYPIVFSNEAVPMPVAVLSWSAENSFVDEKGIWREGMYVPAYARQYPFVFYEEKDSDRLYLCVDESAPHYVANCAEAKGAVQPFYVDGKPSPASQHALQFAHAFYQQMKITREFCEALQRHKLLSSYDAEAKIGEQTVRLNAFLMIDEKAFNALPDDVFLEFRSKGWLPYIYFAFASGVNWKRLPQTVKNT